ncbi:MAG TPA: ATP-binding cassette domain-containing protein, partial [Gemmatimonadales bacterium]|nr:ATP-binding cassette domain-containing protein [Gemmatimonadales bacterium]
MIRLIDLQVRVGNFHLRDISLEVPSGGYALIIGPTGSGKTTLLEAIAGHARLLGGRVFMHNEDVTTLPPERRGIGFVYQQYHLFPHLTVRNNISYGLTQRGGRNGAAAARAEELADLLGITPLLDRTV